MNSHQYINQTSGITSYFTPDWLAHAGRDVLGGHIELDPASCEEANRTIRACRFFSIEDDGLAQPWKAATLWMNHPFGNAEKACGPACTKKVCVERGHLLLDNPGNPGWINKLVQSYLRHDFVAGLSLTFAATSEKWARPLFQFPICFLNGRTNYDLPGGKKTNGVPKGSMVTYLGPDVERFHFVFSSYGDVMIPANMLMAPMGGYSISWAKVSNGHH